jgi:glycerol uptake facilitator-like aquaporin
MASEMQIGIGVGVAIGVGIGMLIMIFLGEGKVTKKVHINPDVSGFSISRINDRILCTLSLPCSTSM